MGDVKFCSKCGNQLKPGMKFCNVCGKAVITAPVNPSEPAAPDNPVVSETTAASEIPVVSETAAASETPVTSEKPATLENPVVSETTAVPKATATPVTPVAPKAPAAQETAATSETAAAPETPVVPAANKPVGMWGYFWLKVLLAIPVIGFICTFILAFAPKNVNVKNFVRSRFCEWIIAAIPIIVFIVFMLITGNTITGLLQSALRGAMSSGAFGQLMKQLFSSLYF